MEQTIFERQEAERNAFFKAHNKAFQQIQDDEQMIRKAFGFSDARMPDEWKEKLQRERQAWSNEWGVQGWRAVEMQSRHELEQKAEESKINNNKNVFTVPPFMHEYFDKCGPEGQAELIKLGNKYQDEKAEFLQTIYLQKQKFLEDWNKLVNEKKTLTADEAIRPLQEKYKEKSKEIASQHGIDASADRREWQKLKESFFANRDSVEKKHRKGMRF